MPVGMGDKEDEFDRREKFLFRIFWEVWASRTLMQRKETTVFQFNTRLHMLCF